MLGTAAMAGGLAWSAPAILGIDAAAAVSPGETILPCPPGTTNKTLYIKWDPREGFVPVSSAEPQGQNSQGDCLRTMKLGDEDRASDAEVLAFLAANTFDAKPTKSGNQITKVVVTIPDDCSTRNLRVAAKQGTNPGCDYEADGYTEHTITFEQTSGEQNSISHVEFAIDCCVPQS